MRLETQLRCTESLIAASHVQSWCKSIMLALVSQLDWHGSHPKADPIFVHRQCLNEPQSWVWKHGKHVFALPIGIDHVHLILKSVEPDRVQRTAPEFRPPKHKTWFDHFLPCCPNHIQLSDMNWNCGASETCSCTWSLLWALWGGCHDQSLDKYGGVFFLGFFFIFFREFFSDSAFLLWLLFCFSASAALLLLLFFCFCCSFAFAAFLLLLLFRFCCSFAFAAFFAFVAFLLLLPFCFCCLFAFVALLLPCAFFVFCVLRALCALCAKAVGRLARLHALSWFHFLRARFFGFALRAFRLFHAGVKFREGCGHAKLTHPFVGKAGVKFREGCCHFNLTHPFCWQGEPPEGKI